MKSYHFKTKKEDQFGRVLRERVDSFLKDQNLNEKADAGMVLKSFLLFLSFVGIYILLLSGVVQNLFLVFLLWGLMGIGQALIGMAIMHDVVHGAYSRKKWLNALLEIPIIAIGVESAIWKIEHNFIHHNYTNIEGVDQDIHPRYFFRFSKNQPKRWFHRFQHLYAVFLYALLTLEWMTVKDFMKLRKYYKEGFIETKGKLFYRGLVISLKKAIFFVLYALLPILITNYSWYLALGTFLTMLVVSGVVMTIIFQTAHVVPNTDFVTPKSNLIEDTWHMHQMKTTANFAPNNKFLTQIIGGLNYQIEHHLFPDICHVHYPKISEIVKSTARDFSMPYYENKSLGKAIRAHFYLLKMHGNK